MLATQGQLVMIVGKSFHQNSDQHIICHSFISYHSPCALLHTVLPRNHALVTPLPTPRTSEMEAGKFLFDYSTIFDFPSTNQNTHSHFSSLSILSLTYSNQTGACSNLQVDVGDNSCNRSEGCNDCTEEVLNNQCNGGSTDCPASCN